MLFAVLVVPSSSAGPEHPAQSASKTPHQPSLALILGPPVVVYASPLDEPDCPLLHGYGDRRYCVRIDAETRRRAPVNVDQMTAAWEAIPAVKRVLTGGGTGQATAEEVRRRLVDAGYRNVVARPARGDDPAAVGGIVHALAIGPACVMGFQLGWERVDAEYLMGTRPDGTCLAP